MKQKTLGLLACTALLCACQPAQKQTTITGTLAGVLIVNYFAVSDLSRSTIHRDTIALQNGSFTCQLENDSVPMEAFFYAQPRNGAAAASLRKTITVVTFPGETVEVSGSMDDYHMKGNAFHQDYEEVRALYKPYEDKMHKVTQVIMGMQSDGTLTPQRLDSLRQIYEPINADMKKVKEDPHRRKGTERPDGSPLQGHERSHRAAESPRRSAQEYGRRSRSPRLHTEGPPRQRPHPYKDRMEILGVDCNDTEEKWKAAVEKHELPWLHVRNTDEADITVKYGIQGYPTKIVIDPEGKVAKIVVGEDPAFYKYLDELFK